MSEKISMRGVVSGALGLNMSIMMSWNVSSDAQHMLLSRSVSMSPADAGGLWARSCTWWRAAATSLAKACV